mgnify:CR=1 FL=1
MRRLLSIVFVLSFVPAAAMAEVKRGDPGASCTTSTETIQGQTASCETCTATKCDTSGTTVSNCRKETTKTCTIGGRAGNPNGPRSGLFQKAPGTLMQRAP